MNNADILILTQWLSPAYPVGSFSFSHGLETAISDGRIKSAGDLENWLGSVIEFGSGRSDVILLSAAYRADSGAQVHEINELSQALCPSKERLEETLSQGASFARTTNAIWGTELVAGTYPVAVGQAAALKNIDLETIAYLYLHSFASNLVSGAVRLVPLGQTEGQSCLDALSETCIRTAKEGLHASLEDLGTCAFASDIASMKHETQTVRIFQS